MGSRSTVLTNGERVATADFDITSELERLERLRASGVIRQNEFEDLKANLLAKVGRGQSSAQPIKPPSEGAVQTAKTITVTTHQFIGLAGALTIMVGCFAPLVHLPIVGGINYVYNGRGDGIIVLLLAISAVALILFRKNTALAVVALAITGVCSFTYIKFSMLLSDMHRNLDEGLQGNPFRGIADALASAVGFGWAWPLLLIGIALLLTSSVIGVRAENALSAVE